MSRRSRRDGSAPGAIRPTVTVCRGCCCGTPKIPGIDHAAQLRDLRTALEGKATVRVTDCLDVCEQANVVVVQPSADGRRAGGRPVWVGRVQEPHPLGVKADRGDHRCPRHADPPA
ncbi:(2Fe-2S) ferredoxin domain-containing protein, partial [Streptomyces sp. NPDC058953]|uniref:(2Fe-2S) ferredoxin domain-containing protein n=1 Tax=Streptomyces sp. NPDC058953 TaxID=3346676 RepID=UPI0036862443